MIRVCVDNLSHSYRLDRGALEVLRNITLAIESRQIVTLLGPSGCGKSTLLRCIAGLIEPSSGTVRIDQFQPSQLRLKKAIGFAFQEPALLSWRTVAENILLPSEIGPKTLDETAVAKKLEELLSFTGLTQFRDYYPDQLSGGMKQRVALARTLLLDPSVLLLDEPLASLDLLTRTRLMVELSAMLAQLECPTIIVTHSVEEAVFWGSQIVLLSDRPGSIVKILEHNTTFPRTIEYLESDVFHTLSGQCREILFNYQTNEQSV
jgi:NitT/TauT family transport system ATP-binding protein